MENNKEIYNILCEEFDPTYISDRLLRVAKKISENKNLKHKASISVEELIELMRDTLNFVGSCFVPDSVIKDLATAIKDRIDNGEL